jgi:hypothetical protein
VASSSRLPLGWDAHLLFGTPSVRARAMAWAVLFGLIAAFVPAIIFELKNELMHVVTR